MLMVKEEPLNVWTISLISVDLDYTLLLYRVSTRSLYNKKKYYKSSWWDILIRGVPCTQWLIVFNHIVFVYFMHPVDEVSCSLLRQCRSGHDKKSSIVFMCFMQLMVPIERWIKFSKTHLTSTFHFVIIVYSFAYVIHSRHPETCEHLNKAFKANFYKNKVSVDAACTLRFSIFSYYSSNRQFTVIINRLIFPLKFIRLLKKTKLQEM